MLLLRLLDVQVAKKTVADNEQQQKMGVQLGDLSSGLGVQACLSIDSLQGLIKRNEGLIAFTRQDYTAAYDLFEAALKVYSNESLCVHLIRGVINTSCCILLQLNNNDVIAANNKAICLMYSQKLVSIHTSSMYCFSYD